MKKGQLKEILTIFLFFFVLFVILDKVTWILRGNNVESRQNIIGFENEQELDVICIGASDILRYWSPLQAWHDRGFTSYNYATSSAPFDMLQYYIEKSSRSQNPRLYIIGLGTLPYVSEEARELDIRGWTDSLDAFTLLRMKSLTDYFSRRNWGDMGFSELLSYYVDIIRYHTNWDALVDCGQWDLAFGKYDNTLKGYEPRTRSVPFADNALMGETGDLSGLQEKAVTELLDYCEEKDVPVLFVVNPKSLTEKNEKVYNAANQIIEERGFDCINLNLYNDMMGIDSETDFYDCNHVNYLGSEKYMKFFAEYLDQNYDLPDHRGEAGYEQWDECYSQYEIQAEEWREETQESVDRVRTAKNIGEEIADETDFFRWLDMAGNSEFAVFMEMDSGELKTGFDAETMEALADWGVFTSGQYYIGVWSGKEELFSDTASDIIKYEAAVGVNAGRGQKSYSIQSGEGIRSIKIDGIEYIKDGNPLHIVLFDRNYQRVIDAVSVRITETGEAVLER